MSSNFTSRTTYFLQEGRENLSECVKLSFQAAVQQNIKKIVIFTAYGDGIRLALTEYCSQQEYADIKIVAVTFPAGRTFKNKEQENIDVRIAADVVELMKERSVPIVRAHLPFDLIDPGAALKTKVGGGFNLLAEALNMFCGSMSLCVQAISLACDAGHVGTLEHVISLTSDTAILAQAADTQQMLARLIIREIICKPAVLTIGRGEPVPILPGTDENSEREALPAETDQNRLSDRTD